MAQIVDLRNVPTVIEIGPKNTVVEATDELVTLGAQFGPTVVEFSWGELIPGPGLKGGGVFEGPVYIDQDIPGLPLMTEAVDPDADYLMLYDASQDLHVKVLAALGGGGGDPFAVTNVGGGAEVHKDTVPVADVQTARLRSFISSSGTVQITELADEIDLGVAGGSFSAFPQTLMPGSSTNICSQRIDSPFTPVTLSYTPAVDTPEAEVGHMALFIAYYQGDLVGGDGNTTTTGLTGWTKFVGPGSHMFMVWYKFLTLEDLNTTHTVTLDNSAIYRGCRDVFIYQNINTEAPFYSFTSDYHLHGNRRGNKTWPTMGMAVPSYAFSNGQHAITITHSRDYGTSPTRQWSDMGLINLGEMQENADLVVTEHAFPYASGDMPCMQFRIVARKANINRDENLIVGETPLSSCQHPSWNTNGVLVTRSSTYFTAIQATGAGVIPHFVEQTRTLAAGEKMTFYVYFKEDGSYPNAARKAHMYIVDPNNNERGVFLTKDGTPRNLYVDSLINATNDHNTVWNYCAYKCDNDGNPSLDGMILALYITAPTAGTYKFRFGPAYGSSGSSTSFIAGTGLGSTLYVSHAGLRTGYHSARRIYTSADAPVSGSAATGMVDNPGYLMDTNVLGNNPFETQQLTIILNPTWAKYPKAKLSPDLMSVDSAGQRVQVNGDTFIAPQTDALLGDDYAQCYPIDKYLHPYQGGVPGKYYWEAVVNQVTDPTWFSGQRVGIMPCFSDWSTDWNTNSTPGIWYDPYVAGHGGWAIGQVCGIALDFELGQVKFYVDNVLKQTSSFDKNVPWCGFIAAPPAWGRPQGQFTVRLKGPFTYTPPTGFVEYDITGDPDFVFGTNTLNVGGGAEIVRPGSPDTYRTLLAGDGISVTQEDRAIRIAQDIPDLPLIGSWIADPVVDTIAIYDSSAGIHKRITPQQLVDVTTISGGGGGGGGSAVDIGDATTPRAVSIIPKMTSYTAPSGTFSASNEYTGLEAWRCADQQLQPGWLSNNVGPPQWVKYVFDTPKVIKSYAIIPWSHDTWPGRLLTAWKLQGSNNGTTWDDIHTGTSGTMQWAPWCFRYFSCSANLTPYTQFRVYITGNGGNGHIGFNHWALYETDVTKIAAGGGGAYYEAADALPSAPTTMDDEFATLAGTNGGWNSAIWTPANGTPSQAKQASSCLILDAGGNGWMSQPITGAAWKIRTKMMWTRLLSNVNQCSVLWVGNAAGTKQIDGGFWKDGAGNNYWCGNRWNTYGWVTRLGSNVVNYWEEIENWFYLELEYDGTNFYWRRSRTGIDNSFWTFLTEAKSNHMASDPAFVGVNISRSEQAVLIDWFRRIS